MNYTLILVYLLTIVIHIIDTLAYAIDLVGVRTHKLAVSISLFNIITIIDKISSLIQLPILGSMIDNAIRINDIVSLEPIFRVAMFLTTIGALIGAILIPDFVIVFSRIVNLFEHTGSVIKVIGKALVSGRKYQSTLLSKTNRWNIVYKPASVKYTSIKGLPKLMLCLNIFYNAFFSLSIFSSIYAGALLPEFRMTVSQLSGIIMGAAIMLSIFIDPAAAMITDLVMQGRYGEVKLKSMTFYLVIGKILGTVLAQLLFLPGATLIVWIAQVFI